MSFGSARCPSQRKSRHSPAVPDGPAIKIVAASRRADATQAEAAQVQEHCVAKNRLLPLDHFVRVEQRNNQSLASDERTSESNQKMAFRRVGERFDIQCAWRLRSLHRRVRESKLREMRFPGQIRNKVCVGPPNQPSFDRTRFAL